MKPCYEILFWPLQLAGVLLQQEKARFFVAIIGGVAHKEGRERGIHPIG
jgi:hypothetical protein